jgi:uncharacterized membrane protein YoaK (UPF0700 family)
MLIRQGDARSSEIDRRLACTLAAIAGAINAAGFHAIGFFSANMTGNVSLISDHIALGEIKLAATFVGIFVAFIAGATISTLLINAGRRRNVSKIYAYSILAEAALLMLLALTDMWLESAHRGAILVVGLSFLMGLQNAVVTRISDARVRTTHISGMSTDIGIGIGMLIDIVAGREPASGSAEIVSKLRLHGQTVLSFLAGGVFGVFVYQAMGGLLLVGCAAVLTMLAAPAILRDQSLPA